MRRTRRRASRRARESCWPSSPVGTHRLERWSWRPRPTPALLALSGKRNPCPGKLGVIEQGALADVLLVDGDRIADIRLVEDPANNLVVVVKNGKIFRNAL